MTAVIYFEGREVCKIEYDRVLTGDNILIFSLDSKEVADFTAGYSYVVISEEKIKQDKTECLQIIADITYGLERENKRKWWQL